MYLVDTDVISEIRKGDKANLGVRAFFADASRESVDLYLSVVTIGELRQGLGRIRNRGDDAQAKRLGRWLKQVTMIYAEAILPFDQETARVWGRLRRQAHTQISLPQPRAFAFHEFPAQFCNLALQVSHH